MNQLLKRKLLLASVIFIAVLPILASALFITYRSFQQAKLDAVDRAKSLLSHVSEKQDELIAQTMQSLRILALLPDVNGKIANCPKFMSQFIKSNPVYVNAGVVDAKGNVICHGLQQKTGVTVGDQQWFALALKTGTPQIGGLQFGRISHKPGIIAAMPIARPGEAVQRIVFLSISVQWLEDVFAEYSLPEKSQITALDSHGIVLFQHPLKLENEATLMGKPYPNQKVWNHIKESGEIIVPARALESDGNKHVYTFQRIEAEDRVAMFIALRFLESAIYREATHNGITLILGLCLSLIATFLVAYVAGNYLFLRPVEQEIEKLHDVAETDELTQVLNRRGFERLTEERLNAAGITDQHALLLIDLDHFKKINDTYGHGTGDDVLQETTSRVRTVLRENEIFGRIGGEEFAIFIPGVTRANALLMAERIRAAIDSLAYETSVSKIKVSTSIGVCHGTKRLSLETFLEKADKALYKSKRAGRNKVSI
jgi:diguanylate cyclase (GGDEF)-like protein